MANPEPARQRAREDGYRKWRECDNIEPPHEGECPICERTKLLVYDHCHRTKRFRGWICSDCNLGLGKFNDESICLSRALQYLIEFEIDGPESGYGFGV